MHAHILPIGPYACQVSLKLQGLADARRARQLSRLNEAVREPECSLHFVSTDSPSEQVATNKGRVVMHASRPCTSSTHESHPGGTRALPMAFTAPSPVRLTQHGLPVQTAEPIETPAFVALKVAVLEPEAVLIARWAWLDSPAQRGLPGTEPQAPAGDSSELGLAAAERLLPPLCHAIGAAQCFFLRFERGTRRLLPPRRPRSTVGGELGDEPVEAALRGLLNHSEAERLLPEFSFAPEALGGLPRSAEALQAAMLPDASIQLRAAATLTVEASLDANGSPLEVPLRFSQRLHARRKRM